ncbi:type II toxin-antitoxin system prevent-host-death family antitoxin [Desulfobaculum senezii]
MPKVVTYSEAKKNLSSTMDLVCDTHEPVIITRQNGRSVVLMSQEDYNSIIETACLLDSPENAGRLRKSILSAERDK